MANLRELFAGIRSTFSRGEQQTPQNDVDLREPPIDDSPSVEHPTPVDPRQPLYTMVRENKLDELKAAFDQDADLSTMNMLHKARSPDMVDFLVAKGADVHQTYENGEGRNSDYGEPTPLLSAAGSANVETIQRLIHHGANPDNGGAIGEFPLLRAIDRDDGQQEAVVRVLLDGGASTNGFLAGAIQGKKATMGTISALLEHGADPNDYTNDGMASALQHAAGQGRGELVDLLMDHGADPMQRDFNDCTALHYVTSDREIGIAEKLVARSADPAALLNATDERGSTALTQAALGGDVLATEKLIELGSDLDLAMKGDDWKQPDSYLGIHSPVSKEKQKEAMNLVRTHAVENEKQALRQTFAEIEQEAPDIVEQPVARRRARL